MFWDKKRRCLCPLPQHVCLVQRPPRNSGPPNTFLDNTEHIEGPTRPNCSVGEAKLSGKFQTIMSLWKHFLSKQADTHTPPGPPSVQGTQRRRGIWRGVQSETHLCSCPGRAAGSPQSCPGASGKIQEKKGAQLWEPAGRPHICAANRGLLQPPGRHFLTRKLLHMDCKGNVANFLKS